MPSTLPVKDGSLGYTRGIVTMPEVLYMRALQILGVILILGGLFVLIKSPSYSSEKSVLKIGDVEAKVSQAHSIPAWAGGVGVVAGVILIVVGSRKA